MSTDDRLTGSALEKALRSGELDAPSLEIVGMVKASDEKGKISFSPTDCESWTDVPTDLIKHAERVGESPCRDHTHPVFRLVLADSDDPAAKVLSAVLASWRRSRPRPFLTGVRGGHQGLAALIWRAVSGPEAVADLV